MFIMLSMTKSDVLEVQAGGYEYTKIYGFY